MEDGHDALDLVLGVYEFNDVPTLKHNSHEEEHSKCDICGNYFEFNEVLNLHNTIHMKKNIQNVCFDVKKHSYIFHTSNCPKCFTQVETEIIATISNQKIIHVIFGKKVASCQRLIQAEYMYSM